MEGVRRGWVAACVFSALFAWPGDTYGIPIIQYEATDLADPPSGDDLWEYTYLISGETFDVNVGFTVYFDYTLYGALEDPPPSVVGWDVITWQPDSFLQDDGAYDALSLVDNASLVGPFTVTFFWLGEGAPGEQPFDFYEYDPVSGLVETVGSGYTVIVPEPSSILGLVAIGSLRLFLRRRGPGA